MEHNKRKQDWNNVCEISRYGSPELKHNYPRCRTEGTLEMQASMLDAKIAPCSAVECVECFADG